MSKKNQVSDNCGWCGAFIQRKASWMHPPGQNFCNKGCANRAHGILRKVDPVWRFWSSVGETQVDGCFEWTGARTGAGYGLINIEGVLVLAHRFAYELRGETIPDGLCVLHKCDNPPCVRLSHLFLGTPKDNVQDAISKGRFWTADPNAPNWRRPRTTA